MEEKEGPGPGRGLAGLGDRSGSWDQVHQGHSVGSPAPRSLHLGELGKCQLEWPVAEPGDTSRAAVWLVEVAGRMVRSTGRVAAPKSGWWHWAVATPPGLSGGACPTGIWPQSRTIQDKEVTILNSQECDSFYHTFSKIPALIRIINSQMICAEDRDREPFCYVSTCPLGSLTSKAPGQEWGRGAAGSGRRERVGEGEQGGWGMAGRWRAGAQGVGNRGGTWGRTPPEEGVLGLGLQGASQLCDTWGLWGRAAVRVSRLSLGCVLSPSGHIRSP